MVHSFSLDQQLSGHAFAFILVFTRISSAFMLFPGIGELFVSARIRLLFSLSVSFLIFMPLLPNLPAAPPPAISDLLLLLFREMIVGIFFGAILRLLMDVVETAGAIIAIQIGLSNAMILNPAMATQSALTSVFLSAAALVLVFITGLDHMLIKALMDTYSLFPVGNMIPPGDMLEAYSRLAAKTFSVGTELAAPFLIIGLLLYSIIGFMQRLAPQIQLFLVMLPLQIWGGLILFSMTFGAMMVAWLYFYDQTIGNLFIK